MRNQTPNQISKDFHILDGRDCLAGIKINMLTKRKFPVKYKPQICLKAFKEKNRSAKKRKIEWR